MKSLFSAPGSWLLAFAVSIHLLARPGHAADTAAAGSSTNWTTAQDHMNMKEQLGILRLRPGPSGQPNATNAANYDPAKANPFPDPPDPLTLANGQKVTTPEQWWKQRRSEIVEAFEREVYGRVPKETPKVTWAVVSAVTNGLVGTLSANGTDLIGHVDNSAYPAITVDIRMTLVTPVAVKGPVPVLMMFGGFGGTGMPRPADAPAPAAPTREFGGPFNDPPSREQLLAAGWGYATINPGSVQADNGAGLTKGIIGLVNRGKPRKPDDWGSLRAWAWGAARGLDYLETDPAVDAKRVGIEGVSRYGKAALVTMAFEPRFAAVLVGSSGEGGAKLHRRNFGEAVENLTGSGGYHWMAGNFLKYGTAESSFGSKNAGDLPVDAHELIALCAPRPTFISYGVPARGDANWLDQQGSYMATVAAGPVFRLLGVRDIGEKENYRTALMPPVNTGLLEGELAWRQHDGGHEDRSNMKHFIEWANRMFSRDRRRPRAHRRPASLVAAGAVQDDGLLDAGGGLAFRDDCCVPGVRRHSRGCRRRRWLGRRRPRKHARDATPQPAIEFLERRLERLPIEPPKTADGMGIGQLRAGRRAELRVLEHLALDFLRAVHALGVAVGHRPEHLLRRQRSGRLGGHHRLGALLHGLSRSALDEHGGAFVRLGSRRGRLLPRRELAKVQIVRGAAFRRRVRCGSAGSAHRLTTACDDEPCGSITPGAGLCQPKARSLLRTAPKSLSIRKCSVRVSPWPRAGRPAASAPATAGVWRTRARC
jgi:hypothetical protein